MLCKPFLLFCRFFFGVSPCSAAGGPIQSAPVLDRASLLRTLLVGWRIIPPKTWLLLRRKTLAECIQPKEVSRMEKHVKQSSKLRRCFMYICRSRHNVFRPRRPPPPARRCHVEVAPPCYPSFAALLFEMATGRRHTRSSYLQSADLYCAFHRVPFLMELPPPHRGGAFTTHCDVVYPQAPVENRESALRLS